MDFCAEYSSLPQLIVRLGYLPEAKILPCVRELSLQSQELCTWFDLLFRKDELKLFPILLFFVVEDPFPITQSS
jgi:hypothetical protein